MNTWRRFFKAWVPECKTPCRYRQGVHSGMLNISLTSCSSAELVYVSVQHCKSQPEKLHLQTVKFPSHLPEHLRSFLAYKTEFGSNAKFQQKYIYPEDAVREAILNAIAHRDYSIANAIEIYIFNDRMEIKSPGALLSTLTIKKLYELEGSHESRNALIARVLRENQLMRELGEGMKRIFSLMQEQELARPELYSNGLWFRVSLLNKTVFNQKELDWLKNLVLCH